MIRGAGQDGAEPDSTVGCHAPTAVCWSRVRSCQCLSGSIWRRRPAAHGNRRRRPTFLRLGSYTPVGIRERDTAVKRKGAESASGDSFGTYLETIQRLEAPEGAAAEPMRLLQLLAEEGPVTPDHLRATLGMGFSEFAEALDILSVAELVAVVGVPGQEKVKLTPAGARIAALAE